MSGEFWAFCGVIFTAVTVFYAAIRGTSSNEKVGTRSASASEVEALGARLDAQNIRLDVLERRERALYAYIALDHAKHLHEGWPIVPLPPDIA